VAFDAKEKKEITFLIISATAIGLGVLTKGPVSILVFALVAGVLFLINGFRLGISWKNFIIFLIVLIIVGGSWFLVQIATGKFDVVVDFVVYQIRLFKTKDAGHGGFPLYHFVILLFGMFPASIFAIQGHKYKGRQDLHKLIHIGMITLLWVVLLLFSIVKTKIVHYSSLTYFPLSFLAAYSIYFLFKGKFKFKIWQKTLLGLVGFILGILVLLIPLFIASKDYFIENGLITHSFTIGNLEADPGWGYYHSIIGLFFIVSLFFSIFLIRKRIQLRIYLLLFSSLLFVFLSLVFILPGAEKISQRAVIDFIKEKADENIYIKSFYKSYAVLFYSKQPVPENKKVFDIDWLTNGDIDKDAYFILRIDKKEEILKRYSKIEVIQEKNGYVFCKRTAQGITE
jgi:4-amino-4-deoxy-L-arabinose transferase-like glycosyltransferase